MNLHPYAALWGSLPLILAPFLPTTWVLTLELWAFCVGFPLRRTPFGKWVCGLGLVYLAMGALSHTPETSLPVSMLTCSFVLYFFVVTGSISSRTQLQQVSIALVLVGIAVAGLGILQFFFHGNESVGWLDTDYFDFSFRVYATLENPNVLGEYLLLVIPLCAALLLGTNARHMRLLWSCGLLILIVCMALTYSRGCWLGLALEAVIFLLLYDRRTIILLLVLACLTPYLLPDSIWLRLSSIGDLSDTSTSYRVATWLGTLRILRDHWVTGIGPGSTAFQIMYPTYAIAAYESPHAHNLFLQMLCDTGITGLALFTGAIFSAVRTLTAALNQNSRLFCSAGLASIAGFLLQSMFDYTFYNYRVLLLFWGYLGLWALYAALPKEDDP